MNQQKKTLTYDPPWLWALITGILSLLLIFIIVGLVNLLGISSEPNMEIGMNIAYLVTGLAVAYMCYSICKIHPKSYWYTIIICNLTTIGVALDPSNNQDIWNMIMLGIGWMFSIVGMVIGTAKGKRDIASDKMN